MMRDVRQLAEIERATDMRRLIALLGGRCGCLLNMASLARELAVSEPTVRC